MTLDDLVLDFDASRLATLNLALAAIMFGVALDLRVPELLRIARDPRAPAVGLLCQFLILPAIAFAVGRVLAPTPSVALGLILVASCPGGNVSNYFTWLANGRVEVSVAMTAVSTLAAMLVTPLNLALWGSLSPDTAALLTEVSLDPLEMVRNVALLLAVPAAVGMSMRHWLPQVADRLLKPMKVGGLLFFTVVVVAAFSANTEAFAVAISAVFVPVALLNAAGLSLGYGGAAVVGLPEAERRAVAIEVGIQNSGLGLVLVFAFFDGLGGMAATAAWWGIWHLLSGATVALQWAWRDRRLASAS